MRIIQFLYFFFFFFTRLIFSKSGYMPCERVLLGWAWNECDVFWEIRDLIWLWLFSTPRSLYSLLMSALILVCLWLPTSSTGMPLSSARLRKRSKSCFSIAYELVLCFTWQTSKSTIFHSFCSSWCNFRIWHYSLGSHNVHPRGEWKSSSKRGKIFQDRTFPLNTEEYRSWWDGAH